MADGDMLDILVVGGGMCGILAGSRFAAENWSFRIIERASNFGGVWDYRANAYSHLQVRLAHSRKSLDWSRRPVL